MTKILEKIFLWLIYAGIAIILAVPLLVDNRFFFPFISTKVFLFRGIVEILALVYLFLNVLTDKFRPRFNWLLLLLALFILVAAVASYFGPNFYQSFWGDIERGEGLILWLHLLALMIILTGTLRSEPVWAGFLDVSVGVSILMSLFGLGQALKVSSLLATSGSRVDASLGNAAFFGAYLLFNIAFACYLFVYRKSHWLRFYYAAAALFFTWIMVLTETRGAVLGLLAGLVAAAGLLVLTSKENPKLRKSGIVILLVLVVGAGGLYLARNQSWVKDSLKLHRVLSISFAERTAQTRLATWKAAWTGWREKFVLGWGLENFDVVFNKNFPTIIYEDEGSQVWFDRAHNVIFDRGVTTGIFGLLVFLALLLSPMYRALRRYLHDPQKRYAAIIVIGFIVAYFIQDLFIFESITTYILLIFAWAFFGSLFFPHYTWPKFLDSRYLWIALAVGYLGVFWPTLWKVNIYPAKINRLAVQAMRLDPKTDDFYQIVDEFKKSIDAPTYGRPEYRLQFIEFLDGQLANAGEVIPRVKPVLEFTDEEVQKQISEGPENAKNWLLAMRHYNYTFAADEKTKFDRLNKALSFYPRLAELSPPRPQVYQEAGYSHLYIYRLDKQKNDLANAQKEASQAETLFQKTVALNPQVVESYINLIMLYLNLGDDQKIRDTIALMNARQVQFRSQLFLSKLFNLARANDRLDWVGYFAEEITKLNPNDPGGWINLAVFYATSGNRVKAIEIAGKIKEFGGNYVGQATVFIENVNKGLFEKKTR